MYISELKLWNFRKYGVIGENFETSDAGLTVEFNQSLNVLVGENDSGKTAIIDAIKIILKTHSLDWIKLEPEDFHQEENKLKIECIIRGFKDEEAKNFIEWISYSQNGENIEVYLRLFLKAEKKDGKILPYDIKAGVDEEGSALNAEARELLKCTYLKPLRDAKEELAPKRNSRLYRILSENDIFKGKNESHEFVELFKEIKTQIDDYFNNDCKDGKRIKASIDNYLNSFFGENRLGTFSLTEQKLKGILESLKLSLEELNPGLGSQNLLFIATELLNLKRDDWHGIKIGLIEELEAHLHPQTQLRVIEYLQSLDDIQLILTTHSPNLASKVKLDNIILCHGNDVYSMKRGKTYLTDTDYSFLERFLDVTKANLFFAKGIIFVEGWAEELILPSLAKKIGINLTQKGISIINVGNTSFLRYANIFKRKDDKNLKIPVAIITDLDLKPEKYAVNINDEIQAKLDALVNKHPDKNLEELKTKILKSYKIETGFDIDGFKRQKKCKYDGDNVISFISSTWTLEYCLSLSEKIRSHFYKAVLQSLLEQKEDSGITKLDKYDSAISNIRQHFDNWSEDKEVVALSIMLQILGEDKVLDICYAEISKAIIAQKFALIIENDLTKEDFENQNSINYLIDAIKYVSNEN